MSDNAADFDTDGKIRLLREEVLSLRKRVAELEDHLYELRLGRDR